MVGLVSRLANLRVRRTWRGLYPMTPHGLPLVGPDPELPGYVHAVGMCGQGYMLGPGIGALVARLVAGRPKPGDEETLTELSPARAFAAAEKLR